VFKERKGINVFIVNITGYCHIQGRVAGYIPFVTLVLHIWKVGNRSATQMDRHKGNVMEVEAGYDYQYLCK